MEDLLKNFIEKLEEEEGKVKWAKKLMGWDMDKKNGYGFEGPFADLKNYPEFCGTGIVCFGEEKKYLLFKKQVNSDVKVLYRDDGKSNRDWGKIYLALEKNMSENLVLERKQNNKIAKVLNLIEKLNLRKKDLKKLKGYLSDMIEKIEKKEFDKKIKSYKDLGYENSWQKIPEILLNNHFRVHEIIISRIDKLRWVDELHVKWHVDSSD